MLKMFINNINTYCCNTGFDKVTYSVIQVPGKGSIYIFLDIFPYTEVPKNLRYVRILLCNNKDFSNQQLYNSSADPTWVTAMLFSFVVLIQYC
jgi:hypothetical protein